MESHACPFKQLPKAHMHKKNIHYNLIQQYNMLEGKPALGQGDAAERKFGDRARLKQLAQDLPGHDPLNQASSILWGCCLYHCTCGSLIPWYRCSSVSSFAPCRIT